MFRTMLRRSSFLATFRARRIVTYSPLTQPSSEIRTQPSFSSLTTYRSFCRTLPIACDSVDGSALTNSLSALTMARTMISSRAAILASSPVIT